MPEMTSEQLKEFAGEVVKALPTINGIGVEVKKRSQFLLSLSQMTFPHELVQVILVEQIYRACTITKGEPYHK